MKHFLSEFENLHDIEELTYNVHNITILAEDVRRFGSLDRVNFSFWKLYEKVEESLPETSICSLTNESPNYSWEDIPIQKDKENRGQETFSEKNTL